MTTPNIPEATDEQRRLARDWAESVESHPDTWTERLRVAARVILNDVPAPAPPTLAEMTAEERVECRRMQCDYAGITRNTTSRGVIGYFDHEEKKAVILTDTNGIVRRDYDRVTPRPDLPKLEWPGDTPAPAAPALPDGWKLADHPEHGRVVVTRPTPGIDGWVYGVFAATLDGTGFDWHPYDPAELTLLDQEANQHVPPNTLALGSVWDDTDALADACEESGRDQITVLDTNGYAFIWAYDAEWWEGSAKPIDAPFTIIHTGREADQ